MKASLAGGTGLIGSFLINLLNEDPEWESVQFLSRRKVDLPDKFTLADSTKDYRLLPTDVAFCTLGTTMANAGSKEAFYKVDHDMVIEFAKRSKAAGAKMFVFVSSVGASSRSSTYYLKVKGEVENHLKELGFESLIILRPSMLIGPRKEQRFGETVGKKVMCVLDSVMLGPLKKYRGINAATVASVMVKLALVHDKGTLTLESDKIQELNS